jgi:integrase
LYEVATMIVFSMVMPALCEELQLDRPVPLFGRTTLSLGSIIHLLRELDDEGKGLVCVCLGLRVSEALALRWEDVHWEGSRLSIRRGIVEQVVGDVKTEGSARTFTLTSDLLDRLRIWKRHSEFSEDEDWIFASPVKIGRLPYS